MVKQYSMLSLHKQMSSKYFRYCDRIVPNIYYPNKKKCSLLCIKQYGSTVNNCTPPNLKPKQFVTKSGVPKIQKTLTKKITWMSVKILTMSCYTSGVFMTGVFSDDTQKIQTVISEKFEYLLQEFGYEKKKV